MSARALLDARTAVLGKQHFHVLAFFNPSSKSKPDMSGKAKSTTMQSKRAVRSYRIKGTILNTIFSVPRNAVRFARTPGS